MRREREPTRVSYKIVTRLSYWKKKSIQLYMQKYVQKLIKADGYVVWIPSLSFRREIIYIEVQSSCFSHSLCLCIFRTRNPKRNNLPLFCMIAEGTIFRKLRQL